MVFYLPCHLMRLSLPSISITSLLGELNFVSDDTLRGMVLQTIMGIRRTFLPSTCRVNSTHIKGSTDGPDQGCTRSHFRIRCIYVHLIDPVSILSSYHPIIHPPPPKQILKNIRLLLSSTFLMIRDPSKRLLQRRTRRPSSANPPGSLHEYLF
jgi:hypothetical protein